MSSVVGYLGSERIRLGSIISALQANFDHCPRVHQGNWGTMGGIYYLNPNTNEFDLHTFAFPNGSSYTLVPDLQAIAETETTTALSAQTGAWSEISVNQCLNLVVMGCFAAAICGGITDLMKDSEKGKEYDNKGLNLNKSDFTGTTGYALWLISMFNQGGTAAVLSQIPGISRSILLNQRPGAISITGFRRDTDWTGRTSQRPYLFYYQNKEGIAIASSPQGVQALIGIKKVKSVSDMSSVTYEKRDSLHSLKV